MLVVDETKEDTGVSSFKEIESCIQGLFLRGA